MNLDLEHIQAECQREKDADTARRMHLVIMVRIKGTPASHAADLLDCTPAWASKWLARFDACGIKGLRGLPRSGRPPRLSRGKIKKAIRWLASHGGVTPEKLRAYVKRKYGIKYHVSHAAKFLRRFAYSPKVAVRLHARSAGPREIRRWYKKAMKWVRRMRRKGHAVLIQDETVLEYDSRTGRKYWTLPNERVTVRYEGKHKKRIGYGMIGEDGERIFRIYGKFNAKCTRRFFEEARKKFGKISAIMDGAPQHTGSVMASYLRSSRGEVAAMLLPPGCPFLSAIEEYWRQLKRTTMVSEEYESFADMLAAVSEYMRTRPVALSIMSFLARGSAF